MWSCLSARRSVDVEGMACPALGVAAVRVAGCVDVHVDEDMAVAVAVAMAVDVHGDVRARRCRGARAVAGPCPPPSSIPHISWLHRGQRTGCALSCQTGARSSCRGQATSMPCSILCRLGAPAPVACCGGSVVDLCVLRHF
jgi:hypothetical protein